MNMMIALYLLFLLPIGGFCSDDVLSSEVQQIKEELRRMKVEYEEEMTSMREDYDRKIQGLETKRQQDSAIAFTAYATYNPQWFKQEGVEEGDWTVSFDGVLNQVGDGYDTSTGIFTCPVTGFYSFYGFIGILNNFVGENDYESAFSQFTLMKDSDQLYTDWSEWRRGDVQDFSFQIVTQCAQGEQVYMKVHMSGSEEFMIINASGEYYGGLRSMLSGYLIFEN